MTDLTGFERRLDTTIDTAVAAQRIVGATVAVAHQGEPVYLRAAGFADREAGHRATPDTIYRLASLTKAIVSVTALMMTEREILSIDGAVTDWLPEFTPRLPNGRVPVISLRHLLSHTAGLSYGFNEPRGGPYERAGVSNGIGEPDLRLEDNLRRIASVPLSYPPGEGWAYSVATDVLGAVLEKAGGGSIEDVVHHYVTGPLGMNETSFVSPSRDRLTAPYADGIPAPVRMGETHTIVTGPETGITFMPDRSFHPGVWYSAGSGLFGTASDYLKFLIALGEGRLLTAATLADATANHSGNVEMPSWNLGKGHGAFSGLLVDPAVANSRLPSGTWEWSGLYGTSWFFDPASRTAVVALTNTALEGCIGRFPSEIAAAIYGGW